MELATANRMQWLAHKVVPGDGSTLHYMQELCALMAIHGDETSLDIYGPLKRKYGDLPQHVLSIMLNKSPSMDGYTMEEAQDAFFEMYKSGCL